jgi:hypothetical protein
LTDGFWPHEQILLCGKINNKDFDKEWTKGRGQWSIAEHIDDADGDREFEEESSSERDSEREGLILHFHLLLLLLLLLLIN